jgi:hypothetical protein
MLADGTIHEYEINTEAIRSEAPGTFWIVYIVSSSKAWSKSTRQSSTASVSHPLSGSAFESMIDHTAHRDELIKGPATLK